MLHGIDFKRFKYHRGLMSLIMTEEDTVICEMCGKDIPEDNALWLHGNPYCDSCYREAEALYGDY